MKKRRKPLILLKFPAEFLAFPRWFEHPTYRLGDVPKRGLRLPDFLQKLSKITGFQALCLTVILHG